MSDNLCGIFFDFDGTIAETERFGQRVAYNRAFADLGLDWHWDEVLYADLLSVAGGKERLRYYLERYRPGDLDAAVADGTIVEIHGAKIRHFASLAPQIALRRGVKRLIDEAHRAGLVVAIATTASKLGVEALLGANDGLLAKIDLIAANECVERKKPDPDVYLWALAKLGLAAEACVAIEDSNVGLRAARAAGLRSIITISDYTAGDDFAGASAVLSDLGEIDAPARSITGLAPMDGVVDVAYLRAIAGFAMSAA